MVVLLCVLLAVVAAQPTEALGTVSIRSQPGVEVVWEDVPLGRTDGEGRLMIEQVPPGTYRILLRKDGFLEGTLSVDVSAGETAEVRLQLKTVVPPPKPVSRPRQAAPEESVPQVEEGPPVAATEVPSAPSEPALRPEAEAPEEPAGPPASPPGAAVDVSAPASAEPVPEAAEEEREGWSLVPPLLLLLALAGGVVFYALRRARVAAPRAAALETTAPFPDIRTVSAESAEPVFIDELKRREQDLDEPRPGPRRPKVIEIEVARVRDAEGRAE